MNIESIITSLLTQHSPQEVLESLAKVIKNKETIIEARHNNLLGNAFDNLIIALVNAYPSLGKRKAALTKMTLLSISVQESLKLRHADSDLQSTAMKEAYNFIYSLKNPRD